jgi:hypothetical protein
MPQQIVGWQQVRIVGLASPPALRNIAGHNWPAPPVTVMQLRDLLLPGECASQRCGSRGNVWSHAPNEFR